MTTKYHYSTRSSKLVPCRATKRSCQYGEHYDAAAKARIDSGTPKTDSECETHRTIMMAELTPNSESKASVKAQKQIVLDPPIEENQVENLLAKFRSMVGEEHSEDFDTLVSKLSAGHGPFSLDNLPDELNRGIKRNQWIRANMKKIHDLNWDEAMHIIVNSTNPQSYGAVIESRYLKSKNWVRVPSTLDRGDGQDPVSKKYYEIKASVTRAHASNMVNLVQIRLHQKISGYRILIINETDGKTTCFHLTEAQMRSEVGAHGDKLAHGIKGSGGAGNRENAVRFKANPGNKTFERWNRLYKVPFDGN